MEYRTSDFYMAAFIKAKGIRLIDLERQPDGRCHFIFDLPLDLTEKSISLDYYGADATVHPREFASAIKALKSLLHTAA